MVKSHQPTQDDLELALQLGLDAVTFQRFLKLGLYLFTIKSFLGLFLLAPVNYYSLIPSVVNSTGILYEDVLIDALSVNNVPNRSPYLWVHLVFTWIFSILSLGKLICSDLIAALIAFYRTSIMIKMKYESLVVKEAPIDSRSIMVFGVPKELQNEISLAGYFDSAFDGLGKVENVVIARYD
jgi:hypothetical protein